ncbi:MAG: 2-hydroxychromene-2-carboxylate isomerase [Woeseia sp.]|jgi:2-hydroxychromene-2-carboxylate isomerase|nr:2-hydroxychromene-2-carboxylate isomerase [Woeseia sp.]
MTQKLEFFYDYVSLYSYLANSQLSLIDAEVVYRPMLLGGVMNAVGNKPPATLPARGTYLFKDAERWAKRYGIDYKMNPTFPQNTVSAMRLALVAQEKGVLEAVHQPLFDAVWAHEKNLSDVGVLADIISGAGLLVDETMAEINSVRIKGRLRENTDEAVARGAFGAPTMFVGGEMFFGNDRLDFVKEALNP